MNHQKTKQTLESLSKKTLLLSLMLALALCMMGLSSCASPSSEADTSADTSLDQQTEAAVVEEGAAAPDFSFTTIGGEAAQLSDLQDKVVLLNFWSTWCTYCIDEMPAMQQIVENYPDVVVLAVNRGDTTKQATAFVEENSYDFTWALDDDRTIQNLYPANGIPYSIIIDKEGVINKIYEGSAPEMYSYFEEAVVSAGA